MNNLETKIEDAVVESVTQILRYLDWTDTKVILANENGREPKDTYCLINILDIEQTGQTQTSTASPLDQLSENFYTNHYTLSLQISFIGEDSGNIMFDFSDSAFSSRTCIEMWQKRMLGPLTKSNRRRIPQRRETKWVKAYNIDLNLSFSIESRELIDWVEDFVVESVIN